MILDMFVDTLICGFQIICNIIEVNKYFIGFLNSWIALPTNYTKSNVQQILMISQFINLLTFINVLLIYTTSSLG